ncbi:MAG TPA: gephyrin-like molybdotransferase Glp [Bacilli bacterium]
MVMGTVAGSRFRRKAIQPEAAWEKIAACVQQLETIEVALAEAEGMHLAENVIAPAPLPHFARSGMDGFAIRSADIQTASSEHPVLLEVIDNIPCGAAPNKAVLPGTAARTMTGAMVPDGADAVIMLEMTEERNKDGKAYIAVRRSIAKGDNVSLAGSEIAQGELLMEAGRRIGAGEISLLAAFGYSRVKVHRRPVVAVLSTGTELLEVAEPLVPGKIRNSNAPMLAALIREEGGVARLAGKIPDDLAQAKRKLAELFGQADLVITTGGVSVGDYDIMTDLFNEWSGTMLFNKVAMRPGSPTTVGVLHKKLLFALSGNPGACHAGFKLFVLPALRGMQGQKQPQLPIVDAYLAADYPKVNGFRRYLRGRFQYQNGQIFVVPIGSDKSSVMVSIKDAECLIMIPPGGTGMRAGDPVQAIML